MSSSSTRPGSRGKTMPAGQSDYDPSGHGNMNDFDALMNAHPGFVSVPGTNPSIPAPIGGPTLAALNTQQEPYVEIMEQPKAHGLRFRYKCEGRSAGSIPGENSSAEHRTFPTIKIGNMDSAAAIAVVSCVDKDGDRPRPHPHSLVGKDCQKGVCTVKIKNTHTITFPNLGIQCATKREVKDALKQRENIRVDPFQTGFKINTQSIDLNQVRLCFQVFLPDKGHKFTRVLPPVVSQNIFDKKAVNDLVICRLSKQAGSVRGGDEVFLLCEKVNKDDIAVRFFEIDPNNPTDCKWEAYADFGQGDVHRQYAIVFKTPAYRDVSIRNPAQVLLQLKRTSDNQVSDPKPFQFIPDDPDPDGVANKKKRKSLNFQEFFTDETPAAYGMPPQMDSKASMSQLVKDRLKVKATKRSQNRMAPSTITTLPEENMQAAAAMPHYSIQNLGVLPQQGQMEENAMLAFDVANMSMPSQMPTADVIVSGMPNLGIDQSTLVPMVTETSQASDNMGNAQALFSTLSNTPMDNSILEFMGDQLGEQSGSLNFSGFDSGDLGLSSDLAANIGAQEMVGTGDNSQLRDLQPHS